MPTAQQMKSGWTAMRAAKEHEKQRMQARAENLATRRSEDPALDAALTHLSRIERNTRNTKGALNAIGVMLFLFFLILLFRAILSVISTS